MIHAAFTLAMLLSHRNDLADLTSFARTYDRADFRFRVPTEEQLRRTRALVAALMRSQSPGTPPAELVAQATAAGFVLQESEDGAGRVWVLHEPEGVRGGAGLYAFRPGDSQLCVQAPHSFYDQRTGDIGLALFARLEARCFFINTVHRHARSDSDAEHPADVAHAERTHFQAATRGLLDVAPFAIVQVHGYGGGQGLPDEVRAVVSDGQRTRPAGAPAARLRRALVDRLGAGTVRLYGRDTDVLGATMNIQGRRARRAGATFLHIEMSADTRRALQENVAPLAEALRETLRPGPDRRRDEGERDR